MAPAVAMLKDTEVFDLYDQADGPIRISAPGRRVLTVIDASPAGERLSEQNLELAVASVREGMAAIEAGRFVTANESVSKLRAKYGL